MAARLGLSDEQRAEVQRLIALRSQELAKAPKEQWSAIEEQNEQKLAGILTPAQKTLWPKLFEQKLIYFIFKFQRWEDVLQWFAEQAGLQLVMDAPPPGTLNFADQRGYTPSEAIDVLNSVLQTKGYTLIRNDNMLMLFDLKRGRIPVQFLPKLKPEDLPERGRFEYTTVIFPLERRNRSAVIQMLEPFKGPYCQIVPMPGNSLMITDTASTLMVLQKVIDSVENPPLPAPTEASPTTPSIWKTYHVEKNDPARIEEIFKEFAPTGKSLRLGNSREIHFYLPEAGQAQLETILKMLESDTGIPTGEPVLASYSIEPLLQSSPQQLWRLGRMARGLGAAGQIPGQPFNPYDPSLSAGAELVDLLKKTFPAAVISEAAVANHIVVLAVQADQDKIKTLFESLRQTVPPEDQPVAKLYRYADAAKKMNDETLKQLRRIAPTAVFSLDDDQGRILVVATAKEQELLAQAVTELEAAAVPEEDKIVVSYRMSPPNAARFSTMLRQLAAKKELDGVTDLRDSKQGQVTVWATAKQHETIRKILDEITGVKAAPDKKGAKPEQPVLAVYPMERGFAYTAQAILANMFADGEFTYDYRSNAVIAIALPETQGVVKKAIEELDKGVDEDIAFITLKQELAPEILRQLSRVAPKSVVVQNRRHFQIIATGPKQELDKIKAVLAASEAASATSEEVVVHTFQTASPSTVLVVLASVFPEVKATINHVNNQLILQMRGDLKEPVTALLTQLDGALEFVPVKKLPSDQLLQSLRTVAPRATVIVDQENSQIMIQGAKPDVEKIKTIVAQSESAAPLQQEVIVHTLKHVDSTTIAPILREIHPDAKISDDTENGRLVIRIRPDKKEAIRSLLAQLDSADPEKEKRSFKSYPIDTGFYAMQPGRGRYTPLDFVRELQKLAPRARLSFDEHSQQLIVWGTEEEHKIIDAAVKDLTQDGQAKKYARFQLRRADPYLIMSIVRRMFPTALPTYDYTGQSIIVEGHPRLLEKIGEMIVVLDPPEPTAADPTVRFYTLQSEPTTILVQGLQRLVPTASITPDKEAKQLMVIAKPDEQKIIESNVKAITSTFTAPEEPMLFIYPATKDQRARLEAFVRTAARDLRGVSIVPDQSTGSATHQVSVWAKPSEHQLIAAVLKQMRESSAHEPARQLKVFYMSIGDLVTAQEILKVSHPDAMPFVDRTGNRLLVWGTPEELGQITETLTVQGNLDHRQMLAYPVAGAKPDTVMKVIQDVFKGLKITPEPQSRRLLVWASPDEHVKVAEIVQQANKEADPESELAEKFVAYSAANLDVTMIQRLFDKLFPDAIVFGERDADKITIRALAREHAKIKELFEQLREKDEAVRPIFAVYQIGETDPVLIEAMLRGQLPNAESMTPDDIVRTLSPMFVYERYPQYQYYRRMTGAKKIGYYKVDPQTQTVCVFVSPEDQTEVAKAIEQIVLAANEEGIKPIARRYSLDEVSYFDIQNVLQKVAPSAGFQAIYTHTPGAQGRFSLYASNRDFIAYARESEHEKIEVLVKELNAQAGFGKKELFSIMLPEGSRYGREQMIETIQRLYPDTNPSPGALPNQILIWAAKHKQEQVQHAVAEACKPVPEGGETIVKSYPLQFITVEEAKAWLSEICPNASFEPLQPAVPGQPRRALPPQAQARRYQRPEDARFLVVMATPLEHLSIEKAIRELDKDLPESHKMVPRFYTLDDIPANMFYPLYGSLNRAFSNIVCTPAAEQQSIMVVATEADHKQVAEFVKAYREDREIKRPSLEVYALKRQNYYRIQTLISRIAPSALIFPSSKPDQIAVWGTPKDHLDVSTALTRLETASQETDNQVLKIYKVGNRKAHTAYTLLYYQFPGSVVFPINQDEIIAWTSPVDHEAIAKMLGTVAEAFPEPVLKTYYFQHVPLGEGFTILNRMFAPDAALSIRQSTGDLLVHAPPDLQERIARTIAEFDKPRPVETESLPVAYDLSDIPLNQINYAAQSIRAAIPGMIVLPSSVPGQLVVWGKIADQRKVKAMVDQMLSERPESTARMETFSLHRGTAVGVTPMLRQIAPNARFGYGTNPNQLLVWSKESDLVKIGEAVDKLNEADPDMLIEAYSLKNIYSSGARSLIQNLIQTRGLDAAISYDFYTNQMVVQAKADDQKTIASLLDKLRTEDRDLEVFLLETVDPLTAYTAIHALFADESYYTTPAVEVDQNTNMIFVQGTREQLEKTRRMLVNMGETQLGRPAPTGETSGGPRGIVGPATTVGSTATGSLPKAGQSQLRVIRLEGNVGETIRELEKLWPQYQQNRLLINRQDEPLIQKKEEPQAPAPDATFRPSLNPATVSGISGGFFSVSDPVEKEKVEPPKNESPKIDPPKTEPPKAEPAPVEPPAVEPSDDGSRNQATSGLNGMFPNVYVTENEDGSLTVASYDTAALDQLERILKRINDRIVFEGRDYTIYSVRNISATVVAMKLQLILRERLAGRQRIGAAYSARIPVPRLEITPDETTNTIYVRGAKAERAEVANLIALLDVSELPGERSVRKPIKVPIKNTQATRIVQQLLNVYQQKMMSMRLPGGVYPRVTVDNVTNSIEIIAPEPFATELKEYAEDLDRRTVEEPARKVHVIPLEVKSQVIQRALQVIRQSSGQGYYPYPQYPYGQRR